MQSVQERGESPPTQACREISGDVHTHRAGTHRWKQMEQKEVEKKGGESTGEKKRGRERKKEMGWDVRLFATRTEWFPAELLISSSEGKKNEKSKMPLQ